MQDIIGGSNRAKSTLCTLRCSSSKTGTLDAAAKLCFRYLLVVLPDGVQEPSDFYKMVIEAVK